MTIMFDEWSSNFFDASRKINVQKCRLKILSFCIEC